MNRKILFLSIFLLFSSICAFQVHEALEEYYKYLFRAEASRYSYYVTIQERQLLSKIKHNECVKTSIGYYKEIIVKLKDGCNNGEIYF